MPWWGWVVAGWTGLSLLAGLLIGRWLKSVQLTAPQRHRRPVGSQSFQTFVSARRPP